MDVICNIIIVVGIILLIVLLPIAVKRDKKDSLRRKYKKINLDLDFEYTTEFESAYEKLLKKEFRQLEDINIKIKKCNSTLATIFLTMFIFAILITLSKTDVITTILVFYGTIYGALIFAVWWVRKLEKLKKEYALEYKRCVITEIIKAVDETFVLKNISENYENIKNLYEELNFSEQSYDEFQADDYIFGEKSLVASGIFGNVNLKNSVPAEVEIKKIKTTLIQDIYSKIYDHEDMEEEICIYSDNDILANKLALSGITQIMKDFYEKFGIEVEIILRDSSLYVWLLTDQMFEPSANGKILEKELLYFYYCSLILIIDLTKELNKVIDKIGL